MAGKARTRSIFVKIYSVAGTGSYYTIRRPRVADKAAFVKYDPKVKQHVLFREGFKLPKF